MNYKIDVNIAEDHTMLTQGLKEAVNRSSVAHVSRTFSSIDACRASMEAWQPDVLLLDISMPEGNSIMFCEWLMKTYPQVKVIVVTCHDEYSVIRRMLDLGVHGYVLKSNPVENLLQAIHDVYHGERYLSDDVNGILEKGSKQNVFLTPAEQNVLRCICDGLSNPQIAEKLCMSTETASWYRKRLLAKFNLPSSTSLVGYVLRAHILDNI